MTKNILLVGVGGQGTILAAKILTLGLMEAGYDVKMSEIHGMSQRGGAVSSHVRYGEKVYSPVIEKGSADVLVSFEQMEALRWLEYMRPGSKAVVNSQVIKPTPVIIGKAEYSDKILDEICSKVDATVLDAQAEALAVGNSRVLNILLVGAAAKIMKLDGINWSDIIAKNVKSAFVDVNQKAFARGQELVTAV
ncbi:MAG: indolepyruvate oxidoreductase subunit beta [Defluviitaleaceae bacterium]|nr:indolepyruvate oxidoreductase subunit beta [Defluviitaleaceae bacterium]